MSTSAHLKLPLSSLTASAVPAARGFRGGFRVAGGVTLHIPEGIDVRVREMSPEHLLVDWPVGRLLAIVDSMPAVLRAGDVTIALDVRLGASNERDRPGHRGIEIVAPTEATARAILDLARALLATGRASGPIGQPALREVVGEPRQRDVLDVLARHGALGKIRVAGNTKGDVVAVRVEEDRVRWSTEADVLGPITIDLVGHNAVYTMDLEVLQCGFGTLFTTLPTAMRRIRHRNHRRAVAPSKTFVEIAHPLFKDLVVRRAVRDISAMGLSFFAEASDLLYPEMFANEVVVTTQGREMVFSAEVRTVGNSFAGLRLLPSSAIDEAAWLELVDKTLHPTTEIGARWSKATWRLYEKAGYLSLSGKDPERFAELAARFESVSERMDGAPELACQAVWPHADGEVDAAMSMTKIYSSSWLVYQLAKVTGPARDGADGRQVLRDLHLRCYEHAQRDPSLRWLIGIPQVKPIWSRAVHHDLPQQHVAAGKAAIVRFRAVEFPCDGPGSARENEFEIGPASTHEIGVTLHEIARIRPQAYVDALDFSPERADLGRILEEWENKGFARKRSVIVARRFGQPVAAAILESADEGVHLFRLLDCVRMFSLASGGEEAFGALLGAARGWYAAMGKRSYVAFLEDDTTIPADAPANREDLGLADYVILAAEHLHELLEYCYEVTAPRTGPGLAKTSPSTVAAEAR